MHRITFSLITKPGRTCSKKLTVVALVVRIVDNLDFSSSASLCLNIFCYEEVLILLKKAFFK